MKATIKLFKALPIKTGIARIDNNLMKKTIPMGFIFSPMIMYDYSNYDELIELVQDVYGITAEKLNNAFHKSWKKVKDTPMEQLVVEQLAHYMTTYGKECPEGYLAEKEIEWGIDDLSEKIEALEDIEMSKIWNKDYIYIPKEALDIPDLEIDNIKLVVIKGYTKKELKDKLLNLLNMGIALSEDTIQDVVDVALFVGIDEKDISTIRNKEVKVTMYSYLNIIPENPVEFLRFIVYKITGKTLLIKSSDLISEIKEAKKDIYIISLFEYYDIKYGLEKLSEIFYRFKPIFLALRTHWRLKQIVNKIRRLAKKYHKPLPEDYLNSITSKIKNEEIIYKDKLNYELNKVNTFRKIRLAYALKYRTKDVDSILYKIRNGKGYATDFNFKHKFPAQLVLDMVLDSIIKDVSKNVKDKKIYIPDNIIYTLPATEKQFTGHFPSGTYITIPKDMIFGIHWENVGRQIDLDLSVIGENIKIGWDGNYRTEDKDILFSGDITDAKKPRGATELFYVKKQKKNELILFVNYYNFEAGVEVPFKIIVAKEEAVDFGKNYMVNPNNIFATAHSKIKQRQKILGLAITTINENRFYFAETYIGNSITSFNSKFTEHSRKYLFNFYENTIKLNDILEMAGARIVKDKEKCDIDLSPESLEKDTILNLIK